jgi:multidrug efflux pump subunit AcrA (membrane-fusion protein)
VNVEWQRPDPDTAEALPPSDRGLWSAFREAETAAAYLEAWLALQCGNIPGSRAAAVLLGEPDAGPFAPVAAWPAAPPSRALVEAGEEAIARRQPVLVGAKGAGGGALAVPIEVSGSLYGGAAVLLGSAGPSGADALKRLRWGVGWLEALVLREQSARDAALRERTLKALDVLAVILSAKRFDAAATGLATELARTLGADPVAVGFLRGRRVNVRALSHAAGLTGRMNLTHDIALAMEEAVDQSEVVLHPPPADWGWRITRLHADLARTHGAGSVLTVPLQDKGAVTGAITLVGPPGAPFTTETAELVDTVASMVGPILEAKRRDDRNILAKIAAAAGAGLVRLFGPRNVALKLATIALAVAVWLGATVTGDFSVASPARVEGRVQRSVVAPFNGYVASESVRAGGTVEAGELMATLNDQDLVLERLRWSTARSQREVEYDRALSARERAAAAIIQSQIAQADAQLALIDEQIDRTRIVAPFAGVVLQGDLSQLVGTSVERGQELFRIAPLDEWRVVLEVDERDIAEIAVGQTGRLRLLTRPDTPFPYTVARVTPIAEQRDGRTFYRVEATLDSPAGWIRPAMEGAGRTHVDERLLIAIWTRHLVDWLRLAAWRNMP